MKTIKSALVVLVLALFVISCSKEYSDENTAPEVPNGSSSGTAVFGLLGAPGECTNSIVTGQYQAGIPMDASNTVEITVNVGTRGTYTISTAEINGITFIGTGTFDTVGIQTLILTGTGIPAATGDFIYRAGSISCTFSVSVDVQPATPATFTLGGAPAACTGFTVAGSYNEGSALTSTNTLSFDVNVTEVGSYSITTAPVNGISFSKTGFFTTTGAQTITLNGTGTPTAAGSFNYTASAGAGSCTFSITTDAPLPPATGTLSGAPGACANIAVNGVYTVGAALGATNTVTVEVNVATAGTYSISTNTDNGISFSGTGNFTATGIQTVTLAGSGTPGAIVPTNLTVTYGASSCTFSVTVVAAVSPCTGLAAEKFTIAGQYSINGPAVGSGAGTSYDFTAGLGIANVIISFSNPTGAPPVAGVYTIGNGVEILSTDPNALTNFLVWNATAGQVYVTIGSSGAITLQFCNVTFVGTNVSTGTDTAPVMGEGSFVVN